MRARALLLGFGAFAALVAAASSALAQDAADDIVNKIINVPAVAAWRIDGITKKPAPRSDERVQGGKAVRVAVPGRNEQPWAISASNPIEKPVKAGDTLVLAFWARLEKGEGGAAEASLPSNSVQLARPPYTALFGGPATVGAEWKLHEIRGKADKDYAAGDLNVSLHLATGKQVIDLGPVFVLDLGPGAK
jgi:hypothetical protein